MSNWDCFVVGTTVITVWKVASSGWCVYYNCLFKNNPESKSYYNLTEINRI